MEFDTLILLLCGAIALWSIAGSFGALAQRLERQINVHQLKVDVRTVQRQRRAPSLMLSPQFGIATASDEWDYVSDEPVEEAMPAPLPNPRRAA